MALIINCYVHPNKLYLPGISVLNKKSIGNLKSLILQKAPSLGNVKASGLLLYQVRSEINTAQDLDANVGALFSDGKAKEKLKPLRAMSSLSSSQLHDLHVIVHIPSASSMEGHSGSFDNNSSNSNNNNNTIDNDNSKANDNFETETSPNLERLLQTTNSVIVDFPAFAKRVKLNMLRLPPFDYASSNPVHLLTTSYIDSSRFGRSFKAVFCQPGGGEGEGEGGTGLVIKLAEPRHDRELMDEAEVYMHLGELAGHLTPAFYGFFVDTSNPGISFSILVLSYKGQSLESFDDLSKSARLSIMRKLYQIHQVGIKHCNVQPKNIVKDESGYYLINFSVAGMDHQCSGISKCTELLSVIDDLQVSADDCSRAGLV